VGSRGEIPVNAHRFVVVVTTAVFLATASASRGAGEPLYPDVVEELPSHLQIQNDHHREWLRFSTTHLNLGPGNLQIRGGGQIAPCTIDGIGYDQCTVATQEILDGDGNVVFTHPAGVAFFHPEHNHWHQSAVATFEIATGDPSSSGGCAESACGERIATGVKITFCFVDVVFTGVTGSEKKALPRSYFECNGDFQGLSVGWGDEYHQSTPLQELEVTNLPEGDYYLTHEADPEDHWLEGSDTTSPGERNNFTWVKFRLARSGANAKVTVIDHSPCAGAQCGHSGNP
jgi:hypothetical protein